MVPFPVHQKIDIETFLNRVKWHEWRNQGREHTYWCWDGNYSFLGPFHCMQGSDTPGSLVNILAGSFLTREFWSEALISACSPYFFFSRTCSPYISGWASYEFGHVTLYRTYCTNKPNPPVNRAWIEPHDRTRSGLGLSHMTNTLRAS
jgi:hypothetical protein